MNHPTSVINYGSMQELVEEIGNLRYDALTNFLEMLSLKIAKDGQADKDRGRNQLSEELRNAAERIRNAWTISKPFMGNN